MSDPALTVLCDPCAGRGSTVRETASGPAAEQACVVCRGTGLALLVWRVSPSDGRQHAMYRHDGPYTEAPLPCMHAAPTRQLRDDVDAPYCELCRVTVADLRAAAQPTDHPTN